MTAAWTSAIELPNVADALHLAAVERANAFVTFDRTLVALAGPDGIGRAARMP